MKVNELLVQGDALRVRLSTAQSRLTISQTLLTYEEYEGTLDEIRDSIRKQEDNVESLKQQLHDLQLKEKKTTTEGRLSSQGILSKPQIAGPLRTRFQKK